MTLAPEALVDLSDDALARVAEEQFVAAILAVAEFARSVERGVWPERPAGRTQCRQSVGQTPGEVRERGGRVDVERVRGAEPDAGQRLCGTSVAPGAPDRPAEQRARLEEAMAGGDHAPETLRRYGEAQARLEHAGGYGWRDHATSVLRGLGFVDDDLDRGLETFSGGELTRASLLRINLYPVFIGQCRTEFASGEQFDYIARRIMRLCAEFGTEVQRTEHKLWIHCAA